MREEDVGPRRRSPGRVVGRAVGALLLTAAVGLALLLVVVPLVLGATPYTVLTGSMRPDLPPGSLVVVRPTEPEQIRIGDVITYQIASGRPEVVTHRVVGVGVTDGGRTFTAQGDANTNPDPEPVVPGQVRGVVVYSVPWAGYVNSALGGQDRRTVLYVVAGGVILYGLWQVLGGVRERRRARRGAGPTSPAGPAPGPAADVAPGHVSDHAPTEAPDHAPGEAPGEAPGDARDKARDEAPGEPATEREG